MRITYDHDIELSRWNKIFGKGNLFEIHFFFLRMVRSFLLGFIYDVSLFKNFSAKFAIQFQHDISINK